MGPLQGLLLDMDGTLLDTLEDIREVVGPVLRKHGWGPFGLEEYRRGVGRGVEALLASLLPDGEVDAGSLEDMGRTVRKRYRRWGNRRTRLYPGVPGLLDAASSAGLPMAVVTNKPQAAAEECVKEFLDAWSFSAVFGAEEGRPLKPEPQGALAAASAMGATAGRTALLGDSEVDILTARAAGMMSVGALWGFRDRDTLERAGADRIVSHPAEVVDLILA
jgi:phosphoglycolate phosphatase